MDRCIVCLDTNADTFSRITTQSSEWRESHIQRIIEKHLWWWKLKKPGEETLQWICRQCWQVISSFHNFYLTVEEAHKQFQLMVESFGTKNTDEQFKMAIKQEMKEETHGSSLMEDLIDPLKGQRKRKSRIENNTEALQIEEFNIENLKSDISNINDIADELKYQEEDMEETKNYEFDNLDIDFISHCSDNDFSNEYENDNSASGSEDNMLMPTNKDPATSIKGKTNIKKVLPKKTKPVSKSKPKKVLKKETPKTISKTTPQKDIRPDEELFHEGQNKLECDICNAPLDNFATLKTHFRVEHNARGYAMCCGKKYTKRCLLIDHINVHKNPDYFKCQLCSKKFNIRDCLDNHIKIHQARERNVKCEECGKLFFDQKYLKHHMMIHVPENKKTLACTHCEKKFASEQLYKQHKLSHNKKYIKVCETCGKSFVDSFSFQRHVNEHAGIRIASETCNICGLKLVHKHALKQHIKNRHTAENMQEQKCPYCTKVSPSANALRKHIQYNHTMERKHACNLCDKSFRRAVELKEHLSSHTGEALYTCPYCPRTFISNANMYKHRKISHRIEWEQGKLKKFIEPRRIAVPENKILESLNSSETTHNFSYDKTTQNCPDT